MKNVFRAWCSRSTIPLNCRCYGAALSRRVPNSYVILLNRVDLKSVLRFVSIVTGPSKTRTSDPHASAGISLLSCSESVLSEKNE